MTVIRDMIPRDADAVGRLFIATDEEHCVGAFGPPDAMGRYVAATALRDGFLSTGNVRVATVGDEVVGICVSCSSVPEVVPAEDTGVIGLSMSFDDVMAEQAEDVAMALGAGNDAYMECLSVDRGHRGKGIGRALLEDAIARHPRMMLFCRSDNSVAISLYRSVGFRICGMSFGISAEDGQEGPTLLIMTCGSEGHPGVPVDMSSQGKAPETR